MSVVLANEEISSCTRELKIEVPGPAVEAETKRVTDEYRRGAKISGFRKGKVPVGLVQQKFREEIDQAVVEALVPRYWRQAEAEAQLDPLMPPQLGKVDHDPGKALTFVARVEVRPVIELGDLETFDLPEMEVAATDEEVDRAIEDLRRQIAPWKDAERPAAQGDLVTGKISEVLDDPEAQAQEGPFSVELGDSGVWEELSLELTGKSVGQKGSFKREEGEGEDKKTRAFRIEVDGVRERDLKPLDDEFAAGVGSFESLEELREQMSGQITTSKASDRIVQRERAVTDQLIERHPLELPQGVVDAEIENMLREYAENLAGQGVDLEKAGINWRELGDQVRPQAQKRVHARLLLDSVAEKFELEVAEDEFEQTLSRLAKSQGQTTVALRSALDRSGRLAGLRSQLRREKVLRRLMGEPEPTVAPVGVGPVEAAEDEVADAEPAAAESETDATDKSSEA